MIVVANTAAVLCAAFLLYVYVAERVNVLRFGSHKASWVLMHIGLGGASGFVLDHSLHGLADWQDGCVLLAAGAWVWLSHEAFSSGAPKAAASRPVPLDHGRDLPSTMPAER